MRLEDSVSHDSLSGSADQVGEIQAAWRITSGSMMLLGWQREPPPLEGRVVRQGISEVHGRFTSCAWMAAARGRAAYHFLAAIQLAGAELQAADTLMLLGRRGQRDGVLAHLPSHFLGPVDFASELSREATAEAGSAIARYITEIFNPDSLAANAAVRAMIGSFLEQSSVADGCIEIIGELPDEAVVLQGWGRALGEECSAIVPSAKIRLHAVREACFPRPDIIEPPTGSALILSSDAVSLGVPEFLFLLAADGIRRRVVLPERRTLSKSETAGHLRDVLPVLRCDGKTRALLEAALRPRYEGRTSLYDRGHPVRLTLDVAAQSPESGYYLAGWLYDPTKMVQTIYFHAQPSFSLRLDDRWTRITRPDVTAGFSNDPTLPAWTTRQHDHGFAVHIPGEPDRQVPGDLHLEVVLRDGWSGFIPITATCLQDEEGCAALLAGVDLHQASGLTVIDRQMAPFLAKIADGPLLDSHALPDTGTWADIVIVPLCQNQPPRALLSQILSDPLDSDEGIIFVCGANWTDTDVANLESLARFYSASRAAVARVSGTVNVRAALAVGAKQRACETLLLLGAETIGTVPGWRRQLRESARKQGGATCLSPTILYEDSSIRYAGLERLQNSGTSGSTRVKRPLAGLPESFAPAGPPVSTDGVSSACCLIPKLPLDAIRQLPTAPIVRAWEADLDLLESFAQAGICCRWVPEVRVYAPESGVVEYPHGSIASRLARHSVFQSVDVGGK